MSGPMLVAIHVGVVFSCILIMPMSLGGHMAGALDTSSDSHTAPPPSGPNEHRQHLFMPAGGTMHEWSYAGRNPCGGGALLHPYNAHVAGGHMAGALDTSSDSHIAPPPK